MTNTPKSPPAMSLPLIADLTPRGDGTFILKPRVIETADCDTWISPKDAARLLGIAKRTVYDLISSESPYLVARHPAERKIILSLRSVQALRRATVSESFWGPAGLKERNTLVAANRAALAELAAPAC